MAPDLPEGLCRQHGTSSVTETMSIIRSMFHSRIDNEQKQQGFLSSRAQAVYNFAEEIVGKIERVLGQQVDG